MAKKTTKNTKAKTSTKVKNKEALTENIIASGTQSINYMGEITFKVAHGNKTISTKKYSNSGMPTLFKFLCNALAGTYTETLRPCQIKLYYYEKALFISDPTASPSNFNWTNAVEDGTLVASSPYILYDSSPKVKRVVKETQVDSYEVTYHFRIPFSLISNEIVHAVGFFPQGVSDEGEDVSAYYLLTKADSNGIYWDPLELNDTIGNYSIILDWTMTVMNKPVEIKN